MEEGEQQGLPITTEMRRCIEAASDSYSACTETLTYSLDGRFELTDPRHLRLLIDCAEVCQTTENALLRASELGQLLATVCAEACEKVAESCRRLDAADEQLGECADVCMRCADCCRELAI
jgi:hypothetical protein